MLREISDLIVVLFSLGKEVASWGYMTLCGEKTKKI